MIPVPPVADAPVALALDGFGTRTSGIDPETGDAIELLDLSPELVEHSGFVATLAERVARFATVRHASYVHLRRLDRPSADRLELVSDFTPGWRLSELLAESTAANIPIDITVVMGLLRQLLPAVALYGRHNRDAAIAALAVERLIVTPQARLVIAEHVFGPSLDKLNFGRDKLWSQFRVAMPPSAGLPRANQRADANAIGVIALALLRGRTLAIEEYPSQLPALVEEVREHRDGELSPLSPSFAGWLGRALQLDVRSAFQAPSEAQLAFESVLASDRAYVTSTTKVEEWVAQVAGLIDAKRPPAERPPAEEPIVFTTPVDPEAPGHTLDPSGEPPFFAATPPSSSRMPLIALGAVIAGLLLVIGWLWTRDAAVPRAGEGDLVVQSRPPGARVTVDGSERGVTPITVRLPSGPHVLEVQAGTSEPRVIPLTIQANVQTAQYIEMQGVQDTGTLEITSEPSGARVVIDGQPRGITPATIRGLSAGDHSVVVEAGGRKVTQAVNIAPGSTAQLVVPIPRR